jgi:hypothetical protein
MKPQALATQFSLATGLVMLVIAAPGPAAVAQGAPSADERVATLRASLQENQARLRQYEWIETTIISLKGEEKSRKQQRCYYGADGKVQKLPIAAEPKPAAQQGGGRRGGRLKQRIVENKKDEMADYMERAANLIHLYVPPSPAQIQQAKDAGKLALRPIGTGRVRLEFTDYLQTGDQFAIDLDGAASQLTGIALATYLGTPEDPVTLNVRFGTLTDGTSYVAQTALDAAAKNIRVIVENSGYRPMAR